VQQVSFILDDVRNISFPDAFDMLNGSTKILATLLNLDNFLMSIPDYIKKEVPTKGL